MNELKRKFLTFAAFTGLLLNLATPAFAATYTISGNNSDSDNFIDVDFDRDVDVDQNNDADVENDVTIFANSGDNSVKDVVGGSVDIDTSGVEVGVQIVNELNSNWASVDLCDGCGFSGDLKIADNNSRTDNDIQLNSDLDVDVDQDNDADVENDVDVTGNSGGNTAKDVANGDVDIDTGGVTINPVIIRNLLNSNMASVGTGDDEGEGLSAWIVGNNSDSDNFIDLDFDSDIDVDQDNDADVENDVDVAGISGENEAKDIAGGSVDIDTGGVEVGVLVDTKANFNWADVLDCCLLDGLDLKISGNNSESDNDIQIDLDDDLDVDQDNDLDCDGGGKDWPFPELFLGDWWKDGDKCADVDITALSGKNEVDDSSTGGEDPGIDTGSVGVAVEVANEANMNVFGSGDLDLPNGNSVDIDIDFGGLLEALQELVSLLS